MKIEKIKKIGFWKEYTLASKDPSVFNERFGLETKNKKELLAYLKSGIRILLTRGISKCVVHGKLFAPHGEVFFDGNWIWSKGVIYYVENYDLQLTKDFIDHVEKANFKIMLSEENIDENYFNSLNDLAYTFISH